MKNLSEMGLLFNSVVAGYGQLKSVGVLEGLEVHRGIFINHLEGENILYQVTKPFCYNMFKVHFAFISNFENFKDMEFNLWSISHV